MMRPSAPYDAAHGSAVPAYPRFWQRECINQICGDFLGLRLAGIPAGSNPIKGSSVDLRWLDIKRFTRGGKSSDHSIGIGARGIGLDVDKPAIA